MDASEANIARAILSGSKAVQDEVLDQETLRYAVQRQIFDPVTGDVLDVRRAVLLEPTVKGRGKTEIMTAANYDLLMEEFSSPLGLSEALGYPFRVLDGRKLFA